MSAHLKQAIDLARKVGHLFLASADVLGLPHITIVKDIELLSQDAFVITIWPCQYTLANLNENPNVSLVIWDAKNDTGYQLSGKVDKIENMAVLDGYAPGLENKKHYPQMEYKVRIRITRILSFTQAPLIDVEA